jgi:hypothetical protein
MAATSTLSLAEPRNSTRMLVSLRRLDTDDDEIVGHEAELEQGGQTGDERHSFIVSKISLALFTS